MPKIILRCLACVMFVLVLLPANGALTVIAESPQWTQFLGPARNGVSPATGLKSAWPDAGPTVLWRVPGGVGMSGVSVSDELAITMWNSESGQVVAALDIENGTPAWSTPVALNYKNGMGDGPRATPTISDDRVYAFTGEGILACLELADGKVVWKKNVIASVKGKPAEYGMASSPLIIGDLVVVTAGGKDTAVVALDTATGDIRWTAVDGAPGYSSPTLLTIAGEKQIVAFTGLGVSGIRPDSGKVLWQYSFKTPYDCNTATPINVGDNVFISSGENHGCVMLNITKSADNYSVSEVWESTNVKSVMRNEWQTSTFIDGHLYGFDNVGSAGPVTHLTCVNAQTGRTVWRENRFGKANLIAADGVLWITTMEGEFVMVAATTEAYKELGRRKLFGKTRQAPSIAGGKAFVRDDEIVMAIKID